MNDSTAATITEQPRRRGDPIARAVNDLLSANAHVGNLDVPALRRLLEFPREDAAIVDLADGMRRLGVYLEREQKNVQSRTT
jgi:hypothetical protein